MKLIDKIQQTNSGKPTDYSKIYTPTAELIEKITDNFAIEFAEWCLKEFYTSLDNGIVARADNMEDLLKIFKKEKGL
jgi:hypothetical protein